MKVLIVGGGNMGRTYAESFISNQSVSRRDLFILEKEKEKVKRTQQEWTLLAKLLKSEIEFCQREIMTQVSSTTQQIATRYTRLSRVDQKSQLLQEERIHLQGELNRERNESERLKHDHAVLIRKFESEMADFRQTFELNLQRA